MYLNNFDIVAGKHSSQGFQDSKLNDFLHLLGLSTRSEVGNSPGRLFLGLEVAVRQHIDQIGHEVHFEDTVNLSHRSGGNV